MASCARSVLLDVLDYFRVARAQGLRPALLEFTHPKNRTPLIICGIKPVETLLVKDGTLFHDGNAIGEARDIFHKLKLAPRESFFPAWLGYFSYEFARFFGKACTGAPREFPDAYFQRFREGLVIDDGTVIHHTTLGNIDEKPLPHALPQARAFRPSMSAEDFAGMVKAVKARIREGDVYQVNVSMPFFFDVDDDDMIALYAAMRSNNKSPFMGIMTGDDWWMLSGSPERLFSLHDGRLTARPIAGTKGRMMNEDAERDTINALRSCPKENAEHAMLVDLMRNDLNQIAVPGTVTVDEDRSVEFYRHVMHLVSEISCTTTETLENIFSALFPGGTITGAPKLTVMNAIAKLEAFSRGPYTGSLGYVSSGYGADFNILIRSIYARGTMARINAGAGIVIDSNEESEWHEIARKAQAVKDILENNAHPKPLRAMLKGPALSLHIAARHNVASPASVLFIENFDSFSFNIVDALRSLGARVTVQSVDDNLALDNYSHVVLGPGPGNPERMPSFKAIIESATHLGIPLLGICLGHQAIGHHFGARIRKLPLPMHGKPHDVHHFARGLFSKLRSPITFTRYHSLAISNAPREFDVDAYTEDDSIMAIRHHRLPLFGVQFHPESYLSQGGHMVLRNFLDVKKR